MKESIIEAVGDKWREEEQLKNGRERNREGREHRREGMEREVMEGRRHKWREGEKEIK